jgi:alpha-D-xyloside xylohydrolase
VPEEFNHFDYPTYIYDPFNPDARAYLAQALDDGYGRYGISGYWLDADEPQGAQPGREYYSLGRDVELGLAFPRFHQQGIFEGQMARGAPAAMSLSRGAWLGSAQFGGAVWSGDIQSNWTSFAQQVAIGQNMMLSGTWLWTTDVGGFVNGNMNDPSFIDLIVRWFQWGAFCPLFRVHGVRSPGLPDSECGSAGAPTEVWAYGARNEPILTALLVLRDRLRGYIADKHVVAQTTGVPIQTPTWFHFPDDAESYSSEDQVIFGGDWLIAPVLEYQATSRSVWLPTLPSGESWVSFYDGTNSTRIAGGQRITVDTSDISRFPLFFRDSLNTTRLGLS